jgi:hypothetical protein
MPEVADHKESTTSMQSGILAIIEHGVQQFIMHLNPWTMASIAFPLNRSEFNSQSSRKSTELQPESLKLVDLGSTSMFGVLQDNRYFCVKQIVKRKTDHEFLELLNVSSVDFGSLANPATFKPLVIYGNCPVISQLVPLNRNDSVLVNLTATKRYLVFNYTTGQITKEILHLRGKNFKICTDWQFDIEKSPFITMYNSNSIRRVDINTFEIKKNIDLTRITKTDVPRFPLINNKTNYFNKNGFKYPNQAQKNPIPAKYQKFNASSRKMDGTDHENEIQEVIVMPMMKLDTPIDNSGKQNDASKTKTKFIFQQLGQITIAIPQ